MKGIEGCVNSSMPYIRNNVMGEDKSPMTVQCCCFEALQHGRMSRRKQLLEKTATKTIEANGVDSLTGVKTMTILYWSTYKVGMFRICILA